MLFLLVWSIIGAIFAGLLAVAYMLYATARAWDDEDPPLHSNDEVESVGTAFSLPRTRAPLIPTRALLSSSSG